MSSLIVVLPREAGSAATPLAYAQASSSGQVTHHDQAPVALLPRAAGTSELVALVPARALSWHRIELPRGTGANSPRLRAVLEGLLEDRLLDEPDNLHFALEPGPVVGQPVWVASCNRAWLRGALTALESVQRPANRIVPEFAPTAQTQWHVQGTPQQAELVVSGEHGVSVLPLVSPSQLAALLPALPALADDAVVLAEPAVAALAEQCLQRRVTLQQSAQHWAQAAQGTWDLAQFDLASSGHARTLKRLASGWRDLAFAPRWRPARIGLVALLLAHLLGLNAWAWQERQALAAKRDAVRATLTQSFPGVKVVVDAPLQMERELTLLRQATGGTSGRDLEVILSAFGATVPEGRALTAIEYVAGEARLRGLVLVEGEQSALAAKLRAVGYSARPDGDSLLLRAEGAP